MSSITTHVLDTTQGQPAAGIDITLAILADNVWQDLAQGTTNDDGRITNLLTAEIHLEAGIYRLRFETGAYFAKQGLRGFYPFVPIIFELQEPDQHYHIPLLLNPYGYSTYRGS